jgi:hypothetical protein
MHLGIKNPKQSGLKVNAIPVAPATAFVSLLLLFLISNRLLPLSKKGGLKGIFRFACEKS